MAIAVPGELKGMYEAHKKYGKLRWRELILPSINLAREGFLIHEALHQAIDRKIKIIKEREGLRYKRNSYVDCNNLDFRMIDKKL